jgi:hypothetical protein
MDAELERVGDVRLEREQDGLALRRRVDLFESQDGAPGGDPEAIRDQCVRAGQPDRGLAVGD